METLTASQKHNCSHGETNVIFRKWPCGDVLALFPQVPADLNGALCASYEHVGQHGGADYYHCIAKTKPALPSEYATLKAELEKIGYCLNVAVKATQRDHNNRRN